MSQPDLRQIKPWYRDDLFHILRGVYFAAQHGVTNKDVRMGIVLVVSSICLTVGIDPQGFLKPDDLQLMKAG